MVSVKMAVIDEVKEEGLCCREREDPFPVAEVCEELDTVPGTETRPNL